MRVIALNNSYNEFTTKTQRRKGIGILGVLVTWWLETVVKGGKGRFSKGETRPTLTGLIGLLLLLLAICSCSRESPNYTDPNLAHPRNDINGLPNFAKVSEALYRGAQPNRQGFEALKKMGIKSDINLDAQASDEEILKGLGLKYLKIALKDRHAPDDAIATFLKAVTDPDNQPVFVHCAVGKHRAGVMVAYYRVFVQGWANEKALSELPNFGFDVIHIGTRREIRGFNREAMRKKVDALPPVKLTIIP